VTQPLILTLLMDEEAEAFYQELRARFYPAERNLIPAHLTLFHQLPDEGATDHALAQTASTISPFHLTQATLRSIGRGVAVFFEPESMNALHSACASAFAQHLSRQDSQRFRPHIVLQNKVAPETAHSTLALLRSQPFVEPRALGLMLWRYLGGPWEHIRNYSFKVQP
jgi:2'-5' RNA ligase